MGRKNRANEKLAHEKLDQILQLSVSANEKIDNMSLQLKTLDQRICELEKRMSKIGIKAVVAGGLSGAVVTVGIELIRASLS
ncbi:hypothetical protein CEP49_06710 [Mergibacter septicus]|uniref:hypothetical protein n=1 Tax=Mergibacter septicus TaxID=221402 RepID=UPI001178FBA2|nr:hypothetical protein [Mergibacter septicus]AWX14262.1 hypothetical protein CEP49_06710 [Mergibacter septicus]